MIKAHTKANACPENASSKDNLGAFSPVLTKKLLDLVDELDRVREKDLAITLIDWLYLKADLG